MTSESITMPTPPRGPDGVSTKPSEENTNIISLALQRAMEVSNEYTFEDVNAHVNFIIETTYKFTDVLRGKRVEPKKEESLVPPPSDKEWLETE